MQAFSIVQRIIVTSVLVLVAVGAVAETGDILTVSADDAGVASMRVEIFGAESSHPAYDSGIVIGSEHTVPLAELDVPSSKGRIYLEVRAWDAAGELVSSQVSDLRSRGIGEIASINFEVIPGDTRVIGSPISLQGNVDITGGLTTPELRQTGGGPFFGTCPVGSSIRQIQPNGAVTCEDDTAGGNDNLGNHVASQILQMGSNWIDFSSGFGMRSAAGARVETGPEGRTFHFRAGPAADPATADIARFRDQNNQVVLSLPQAGSFHFIKGHKICRVFNIGAGWSDTLLVSGGWTFTNCSNYASATGATGWAPGCLFNTGFSLGTGGPAAPSPNCGW